MKRTPLLFIIPLSFFSCGDNSTPSEPNTKIDSVITQTVSNPIQVDTETDNTDGNVSPQNDTGKVRLVVSFVSRGFGIDNKTKAEFDTWLATKPNVKWEVHPWGREGELNYCFALSDLSQLDQEVFVKDVRSFLAGRQMIFINEWTWCDNYRRK